MSEFYDLIQAKKEKVRLFYLDGQMPEHCCWFPFNATMRIGEFNQFSFYFDLPQKKCDVFFCFDSFSAAGFFWKMELAFCVMSSKETRYYFDNRTVNNLIVKRKILIPQDMGQRILMHCQFGLPCEPNLPVTVQLNEVLLLF